MGDQQRVGMFKGVHHVGLTVSDLDQSFAFYERLLGRLRDFSTESDGAILSKAVGVPDARLRFGFITLGSVHLELLEYQNPRVLGYRVASGPQSVSDEGGAAEFQ